MSANGQVPTVSANLFDFLIAEIIEVIRRSPNCESEVAEADVPLSYTKQEVLYAKVEQIGFRVGQSYFERFFHLHYHSVLTVLVPHDQVLDFKASSR
jgi:hypothetical protein